MKSLPKRLERRQPDWLPENLPAYMDRAIFCSTATQALPELIRGLRGIDQEIQPKLHDYTVCFVLDLIEYDIPKAHSKGGLQRMIERRFRKPKIVPIAGLRSRVMEALGQFPMT